MKEQIEEMEMTPLDVLANDINQHCPDLAENYCGDTHCVACLANALYNAGYRKQIEGEWETIPDYQPDKLITYRHICSECKTTYKDVRSHGHKYCHECGAHMKGGE